MRSIFRAATGRDDEETAHQMEMRRERQALLARKRPAAPTFQFVMGEAVIQCQVG